MQIFYKYSVGLIFMNRRELLLSSGGGMIAMTAGCSLTDSGSPTESPEPTPEPEPLPGYYQSIPQTTVADQPLFFTHVDWSRAIELIRTIENENIAATTTATPKPDSAVPELVTGPFIGSLFVILLSVPAGASGYGKLAGQINEDTGLSRSRDGSTEDAAVTDITITPETVILDGDIDPERYTAQQAGEGFAEAESRGSYVIYDYDGDRVEGRSGGFAYEDAAYAVGDSRVLIANVTSETNYGGKEAVKHIIDTENGDSPRFSDAPDGEWLLRTAGNYTFALGGRSFDAGDGVLAGENTPEADPREVLPGTEVDRWLSGATVTVGTAESGEGVRTERASSTFAATHSDPEAPSETDIRDRYSDAQGDINANTTEGDSSETRLAIRAEFDSFKSDPIDI
jgi:hypothetical protein